MDDRELGKKLEIASKQAEQFFANFKFDRYRKVVHQKAKQNTATYENSSGWGTKLKGFAAIAVIFVLLISIPHFLFTGKNDHVSDNNQPIIQQPIIIYKNRGAAQYNLFPVLYIPVEKSIIGENPSIAICIISPQKVVSQSNYTAGFDILYQSKDIMIIQWVEGEDILKKTNVKVIPLN
ncbi:MAG: hypothetical protein PHP06_05305 [Clostridia bacterium]|nr:hypothetical protein [Clostridia bacterium]